jgi:hypothetical protein
MRYFILGCHILLLAAGCSSPASKADGGGDGGEVRVAPERVEDDVARPAEVTAETASVPEVRGPDHPLDDLLRLNQIQVKGTHNSYHLYPDEEVAPDWNYQHAPLDVQLSQYGVRQVELDIHLHEEEGFLVYHVPVLDDNSSCHSLPECLGILRGWSDDHPGHHVLFVLIEPKDDLDLHTIEGHYDELDAAILAVWPRERVLTPDDVRGDHGTLQEALATDGWPTLGECRNKALFHLLDSGKHREGYLGPEGTLEGRVLFVRGGPETPWGAVVEIGNAVGNEAKIQELVAAGYLVRTTSDTTNPDRAHTNPDRAAAALASGAHLISSDYPAPAEGAFWFSIPDGSPSRCNPVNAPAECTSEAIENLGGES